MIAKISEYIVFITLLPSYKLSNNIVSYILPSYTLSPRNPFIILYKKSM